MFGRLLRVPPPFSGVLFGTTSLASPPEQPVRARVQLFTHETVNGGVLLPVGSRAPVAWQWSDAAGGWHFGHLDPSKKYGVVAHDPAGQYDPVLKLNLTPTVD